MPRQQQSIDGFQIRIYQFAFGLLMLGVFLFAVRSMMSGVYSRVGLVASSIVGIILILLLDRRYWLLLPFLYASGFTIPGLPFNGRELGCLVVFAVYCIRIAIRRDRPARIDRSLLVAAPLLLWMFFIFLLNPVGLAMFGSETIGGRFYFQILIGGLALYAISAQRIDEHDARLLFFGLLFFSVYSVVRGVVFPGADPDAIVFTGAEPEVSTRYAFIGCATIYTILFSHWSLSRVMVSPFKILLFAVLGLLTMYSGKRRAFGSLALVPLFRVFLTGKERLVTAVMVVLAAIAVCFVVLGDGKAYELPQSAKRTLAIVVPAYRANGDGGIHDIFRQEMREQARLVIRDNPWLGRKGFAMRLGETAWINFGGGLTSLFASHAYSGNWHSTWYAYAADFGIPCMILWLLFNVYVVWFAYKACRTIPQGTYLSACCLYFSFLIYLDFAFSYTSGHSAVTTMTHFIHYGMILALFNGYRKQCGLEPA